MKVKDVLKKINYASAKIDVFLREGVTGNERKVFGYERFGDYYYDEKNCTVTSISLDTDRITVHYK